MLHLIRPSSETAWLKPRRTHGLVKGLPEESHGVINLYLVDTSV